MLTTELAATGRLRRARDHLIRTACFLSGRLAPAWYARQVVWRTFDTLLVAAYKRLCTSRLVMHLRPFWVLALLPLVHTAGDESKRVPSFSGERIDFTAWFMLFSAYVAYKLVAAAPIVAGRRPKPPAAPAAIQGRLAPEPPAPPAPTKASDGTVSNQAEIDAAPPAPGVPLHASPPAIAVSVRHRPSCISALATLIMSSGSVCPLPPPIMACLPTLRPRLICPRAMPSHVAVPAPYRSCASHQRTCGSLRPQR